MGNASRLGSRWYPDRSSRSLDPVARESEVAIALRTSQLRKDVGDATAFAGGFVPMPWFAKGILASAVRSILRLIADDLANSKQIAIRIDDCKFPQAPWFVLDHVDARDSCPRQADHYERLI
jgi:hypothetical protein